MLSTGGIAGIVAGERVGDHLENKYKINLEKKGKEQFTKILDRVEKIKNKSTKLPGQRMSNYAKAYVFKRKAFAKLLKNYNKNMKKANYIKLGVMTGTGLAGAAIAKGIKSLKKRKERSDKGQRRIR